LRRQRPWLGVVSPVRFVPLAEEASLIEEIGFWVMGEVCDQIARWQAPGHHYSVSFEVSATQLRSDHFVHHVQLALEVIESTLIDNLETAGEHLQRSRRSEVRLALDDFGTGYSSLSHQQQLPIGSFKIDRAFIRGLGRDEGAVAVVNSIIVRGHALGKTVVAGGVENEEKAQLLRIWRCDQAQGQC
jgi:EAL domain-containing protein (putative c-di-GMP-specific phosphodiesterase class I)